LARFNILLFDRPIGSLLYTEPNPCPYIVKLLTFSKGTVKRRYDAIFRLQNQVVNQKCNAAFIDA
jgi:hypothetical protein